ncbi:MAG: serine/threonine-protein kinase [Bryobacteraceae bacterium]
MTGSNWPRVKEVFHRASELAHAERAEFLDEACRGDAALRAEVESLLGFSAQDEAALAPVAAALAESALEETPARLGPYRIGGLIGRGGMGMVFRAQRDDGAFDKEVAIKLVQSEPGNASFAAQFERERRILARLDHPGITRLLDGGSTADGRPYLVMELVDGVPLGEYCRAQRLGIGERLALFEQICQAVIYAHQRLVVHRDLKPSNILVTGGGVPKLLDFGLARLVDAAGPEAASRSAAWMTPLYASPEQVRGEALGVSTDVYSLGVILYELLAGRRPYEVETASPAAAAAAICEFEPPPPSLVAPGHGRELRGDLDTIVLHALEKDPARRYLSVEQLAADIGRYRAGMPIEARPVSYATRAVKFVRRHTMPVALGAALAVAVVAGGVATLWQARRAQRAFNDVRLMADTMLFEVHDAIAGLPGATGAREVVVKRALEYLDRVSREAGGDENVQRDLASAYLRIGDVQGAPGAASLGQPANARVSYQRAAGLYEALLRAHPGNGEYRRGLFRCYGQLSSVTVLYADREALSRRALDLVAKAPPSDQAQGHFVLARTLLDGGKYPEALAEMEIALAGYRKARGEQPAAEGDRNTALVLKRMGAVLFVLEKPEEALARYAEARDLDRALVERNPGDASSQMDLSFDLNDLGMLAHHRGDHRASLDLRLESLGIRRAVMNADPKDARARAAVAAVLVRISWERTHLGELAGAEQAAREAVALMRSLYAADPARGPELATAEFSLAEAVLARNGVLEGCGLIESVERILAASAKRKPPGKQEQDDLRDARALAAKRCRGRE